MGISRSSLPQMAHTPKGVRIDLTVRTLCEMVKYRGWIIGARFWAHLYRIQMGAVDVEPLARSEPRPG